MELQHELPPVPTPAIGNPSEEGETAWRLHRRFDRMGRLVGEPGMARLFGARVTVIGLGGVGSFAVEALARSGVGHLRLVDFDRICVTNSNRQLQALQGTIARQKAAVLAERVRLINPQAQVEPVPLFYSERTAGVLLDDRPDFVVDAIDNIKAKCHLLAECRARGIAVVCSTGASGRMDPTAIAIADLAETRFDPLANVVRHVLRHKHAFPGIGPFGIPAVYSTERPAEPEDVHYDGEEGFRCVCPGGKNEHHSCEERRVIYGTAGFVTGAFGLACASVVVRALVASAPGAGSR
ncbi:MAG: tRNA threonylcarbamoyladenosine dehydratase [Myxococcales bacterium]|nr:tRNA threonylcarbamoyladenosine dehydratase [Myxococcales bacterium]